MRAILIGFYTRAMADSVAIHKPGAGTWAGREAARTPPRFRDRIITQFRSPQNIAYLHRLFEQRVPRGPLRDFVHATLYDALLNFSEGEGHAIELIQSDPIAQRGDLRAATGLWGEVRRLNRAFFENRLALLRDQAHIIERRAPRDGISEDEEPYHMRMFVSDSLRPPGLEHLNTPGPLHALREDQSTWTPQHEDFDSQGIGGDEDDNPWAAGDPNRTPEQAIAEYWGDDWTTSDTTTGGPETMGQAYGAQNAWGDSWQENGGTRFMRYPSIQFWQKGGREGIDYDIEETLGTQARELDNHVRRWNMDRVRHPRGQEYRRFGPRSGHVV